MAINRLAGVARHSPNDSAVVAACVHLLDRGWGKADQMHVVDGDIKITIRHILEHIDERPVVVQGETVRCIDADTTSEDDTQPLPNDSDAT
jgi:hypothetical protein